MTETNQGLTDEQLALVSPELASSTDANALIFEQLEDGAYGDAPFAIKELFHMGVMIPELGKGDRLGETLEDWMCENIAKAMGLTVDWSGEDELKQALIEHRRFGFLAYVNVPRRIGTTDGFSWGHCSLHWVYAEDIQELVLKAALVAKEAWAADLARNQAKVDREAKEAP